MFEHRKQPILTRKQFARRVARHFVLTQIAAALALFLGMLGYHELDGLSWIDSLVNASMILGGMGPVDPLRNNAAKIFASFYALFSGLFFIAILGMLLAPFAHRLMHRLHFDEDDAEGAKSE
jgi:hypothetical protein